MRGTLSGLQRADGVLEGTLVARCIAGEVGAWRALHRQYYPVLLAFLAKLGVPPEEIDDACQDVFLQVFRQLPGFRSESQLRTWLYRLCASEARSRRRRARLREAIQRVLHVARAESSSGELSEREARRRVERALERMGEGERLVFVLYELEGLSGKQVAEIARCPEATVWRRLHYARKTFRLCVEEASFTRGPAPG